MLNILFATIYLERILSVYVEFSKRVEFLFNYIVNILINIKFLDF